MFRTPEEIANPDIVEAELHPNSRLRYIQRRLQADEGVRLSVDDIAYILKLAGDYDTEEAQSE